MTWITPLEAMMLALMILNGLYLSPSVMVEFPVGRVHGEPRTIDRLDRTGGDLGSLQGSRHDVVGENAGQLTLVGRLEQRPERALGKHCEGTIGRGEDGEGSGALERLGPIRSP